MSRLLQFLGLEPAPAMKALYAESRENFEAQLREHSVTRAGRRNAVAVAKLNEALRDARKDGETTLRRRHH